jgi:hypothetical protein
MPVRRRKQIAAASITGQSGPSGVSVRSREPRMKSGLRQMMASGTRASARMRLNVPKLDGSGGFPVATDLNRKYTVSHKLLAETSLRTTGRNLTQEGRTEATHHRAAAALQSRPLEPETQGRTGTESTAWPRGQAGLRASDDEQWNCRGRQTPPTPHASSRSSGRVGSSLLSLLKEA